MLLFSSSYQSLKIDTITMLSFSFNLFKSSAVVAVVKLSNFWRQPYKLKFLIGLIKCLDWSNKQGWANPFFQNVIWKRLKLLESFQKNHFQLGFFLFWKDFFVLKRNQVSKYFLNFFQAENNIFFSISKQYFPISISK